MTAINPFVIVTAGEKSTLWLMWTQMDPFAVKGLNTSYRAIDVASVFPVTYVSRQIFILEHRQLPQGSNSRLPAPEGATTRYGVPVPRPECSRFFLPLTRFNRS